MGADPLVAALAHAGVVVLRPRSTGGGTTAKRDAAVTNGGPSPRCTSLISCNPPVTKADPLVTHAGVVVRLPCLTGGRAVTGYVAQVAYPPAAVPQSMTYVRAAGILSCNKM